MFSNCDFYSRHLVLIDVYNNGNTVLDGKVFTSFNSVFELARGLRPIEIENKNGDLVTLIKNEAKLTCADKIILFVCLSTFFSNLSANSFVL